MTAHSPFSQFSMFEAFYGSGFLMAWLLDSGKTWQLIYCSLDMEITLQTLQDSNHHHPPSSDTTSSFSSPNIAACVDSMNAHGVGVLLQDRASQDCTEVFVDGYSMVYRKVDIQLIIQNL